MTGLSDAFNRPINYLRISVTDRCNLRCVYCMPEEGVTLMPHSEILTYEEIYTVAKAAAELGISKVRLTGGEPLVRLGLTELVRMLAGIREIDDLSLTTNGLLLERFAAELKSAGLQRVNISLDTLKPERFKAITRGGSIDDVFKGMAAAKAIGLSPIKINTVVMAGVNDDELLDFARKTIDDDWNVRFIECMPFSKTENESVFVPVSAMRKQLEKLGTLEPSHHKMGNGPAQYYYFPGAKGTVGFITPVSEHFCFGCNRLRLTADGKLRLCLMHEDEIDLRQALRNRRSVAEIKELIKQAVASKPLHHNLASGQVPRGRPFSQVGG
jgi:cyclic pyranopterin phosphate synthase